MKSHRCSLVIILHFIAMSVAAQSNYQPGLVVINGDTVRGFIEHKDWARNPRSIDFKAVETDRTPISYRPQQISYFKVEEEEYKSYLGTITMDQNSINKADVPHFEEVDDTVFLKIITSGSLSELSQYRDKIKTRFFLATLGGRPIELIYRFYNIEKNGISGVTDVRKYRTQLITACSETKTLSDNLKIKIKNAGYTASALEQIVDIINSKNGKIPIRPKSKKAGSYFYVGAGLNLISVSFQTYPRITVTNSSPPLPYFDFGIDIFGNKEVRKIGVRIEYSVGLANLDFKSNFLSPDFKSLQTNNSISVQLLYNFYNKKNLKFYLAPGVKLNHAIYSKSTYDTGDPTDFNYIPLFGSGVIQAGVVFNRKIEVTAAYIPQFGYIVSNFIPWSQKFDYLRIGLNYHFEKQAN